MCHTSPHSARDLRLSPKGSRVGVSILSITTVCINLGSFQSLRCQLLLKMAVIQSLSSGWSFKDRDAEEWLPVALVPSVVQQDLIANNK